MKKLLAMLLTCSMITVAFTSCGEETQESSSEAKSSSSSEVEKEDVTTEAEESEESKEESKKESSESEEETTEEEKEVSKEDSAEVEDGTINLVDVYWEMADGSDSSVFAFYPMTDTSNTGYFSVSTDVSEQLSFNKDGNLLFNGVEVPVTKEGSVFSAKTTDASGNEVVAIEMELVDNTDAFYDTDGTYLVTGGIFYDTMKALTIDSVYLMVNGNSTYCEVDCCVYTDDGKGNLEMTFDDLCTFSADGSDSTVKYVLDGEKLTLIDATGEDLVLKAIL